MSIYSSDTIRVFVGPERIEFSVHKSLLCKRCPFFDRALNGQFQEAQRKEVHLPEDSADAFHEFLSWLYSKKVFSGKDDPQWQEIFRLWILADKLQIPKLQNIAMQKLLAKHERRAKEGAAGRFSIAVLQLIYDNTASDSPLRRVIVDILAASLNTEQLRVWGAEYSFELIQDLAIAWRDRLGDLLEEGRPFLLLNNTAPYIVSEDGGQATNKPESTYLSGNPIVHRGVYCDGPLCRAKHGNTFLAGVRYSCLNCKDVDFCHICKSHPQNSHNRHHKFKEIHANVSPWIHLGIFCDGEACKARVGPRGPVAGIRYKCNECADYDLCQGCKKIQSEKRDDDAASVPRASPHTNRGEDQHTPDHVMVAVQTPGEMHAPFLERLTPEQRKKRAYDSQCINCTAYDHHVNDCEEAFVPFIQVLPPMED